MIHLLFWGFYFVLNVLLSQHMFGFDVFVLRIAVFALFNLAVYYFCYAVLVPRLFHERGFIRLFFYGLLITGVSYGIRVAVESLFVPHVADTTAGILFVRHYSLFAVIPQASVVVIASLMGVLRLNLEKEQELMALRVEDAGKQLELIKSKINPHFILNTLNNIYSINYRESPKTSEVILQLSKVLSYTVYKTKNDLIPVSEELELLESLAGLYQLKYDYRLNIDIRANEESYNSQQLIPSMVLFSLMENAFKHSAVSLDPSTYIRLDMDTGSDGLRFLLENSKSSRKNADKNQYASGLGVNAIRQQLGRHYASAYTLEVEENETVYRVILKIHGFKNELHLPG